MRRNLYRRASLEPLEFRRLLSLTVATPLPNLTAPGGTTTGSVNIANTFASSDLAGNTIVQMQTSEGNIDLELYNSLAPITVANFLSYVNSGAYNNTLFYRADANFIIQTGAEYPVDTDGNPINLSTPSSTVVGDINTLSTTAPTIQNEYSNARPNILGTIAMYKPDSDPNSASTEWFINLADNSQNFDNLDGGLTVFGQVVNGGMSVAQTIGNLSTYGNYGATGTYAELPLINYNYGNLKAGNLVLVPTISIIPAISYTVSSSNSTVVSPTISGNSLSLTYGQAGTAKVTVTATDVLGNTTTDSFNVSVPYSTTIGIAASSKPKTFTYTDANGTLTTVTLKGPGTLTPYFTSSTTIDQEQIKNGTAFSGSNLVLNDLQIQSTTASSNVTITTKYGNGQNTINGLSINAPIKTIAAKNTILTGNVSFTTAKSISANSISSASINGQSLSVLSLANSSSFTMSISGALGSVVERGTLIASTISAASIKSISAASMTGDQIQAGYTGTSFPPASSDLTANASIRSIKVKGVFSNTDLIAASLGTISIGPITTDNGDDAFGLAGDILKSFSAHVNGKKIKVAHINSSNAATAIASLGDLGDFQVDIL